MVEAIREVTVGVEEVGSGDEEDEPFTDHFRPVNYHQQPASHSRTAEYHDPSCSHPREEDEDYFSMKQHEVVRPPLVPKPIHAQSETPVKSTIAPALSIAAGTESEPPRCDSALDSVLAPDLTETHFDIHGLKRYTDAELDKESKKDSGAGFENTEEEVKGLEMPVARSPATESEVKIVEGYFDI